MSEQKKVGLTLGSGGARGLSHIGVLEVFEENGIPIDLISGCSMGSVVGAMYANGTPPKMIHALSQQICSAEYRKLFDITLPRKGLVRGQRTELVIRTLIGDRTFDQMKIPFQCVAVCLEDGEKRVFSAGKVADAVRASISVPGVFEPVTIEGKTYVDGGVLDRVPAGVARDMGADVVIAVDVGYRGGSRATPKNIIEVLMNSYELQEWEVTRARHSDADLVIATDTFHISPADFSQVEECINRGRNSALAALDDIKTLLKNAGIELLGKNE